VLSGEGDDKGPRGSGVVAGGMGRADRQQSRGHRNSRARWIRNESHKTTESCRNRHAERSVEDGGVGPCESGEDVEGARVNCLPTVDHQSM
jgi:hypothetical protein